MDNNVTGLIGLDLTAAFATVGNAIIMDRWSLWNVVSLRWLTPYLNDKQSRAGKIILSSVQTNENKLLWILEDRHF